MINKFYTGICFNDLDIFEPYEFNLKLKNGIVFKFMECYYTYEYTQEDRYLDVHYYSLDNNLNTANLKINYSSYILSYIFCTPIIGEVSQHISSKTIDKIDLSETKPYTQKIQKLNTLENKINNINKDKDLFNLSIKHFYNGFKYFCMDSFFEEAFINFYKIIEIISKAFFDLKEIQLKKFKSSEVKSFLKKFIKDKTFITYSDNKIDSISGKFKKFICNEINDTYSKISLFCNYNKLKFNENDLGKIVSIRNDIVHGNVVNANDLEKYLNKLFLLSREFIAHYFFHEKYKNIEINSYVGIE
jgi:hypothetical protein